MPKGGNRTHTPRNTILSRASTLFRHFGMAYQERSIKQGPISSIETDLKDERRGSHPAGSARRHCGLQPAFIAIPGALSSTWPIASWGDPAEAEDVAQRRSSLHTRACAVPGGSFKSSWLIRVATNRCYDELRRRKRRPQTSLDAITDENESFRLSAQPQRGTGSPPPTVELALMIERCLKGLARRPAYRHRSGGCGGYDYQQIAEITSVSLGTVKCVLAARAKLRDCLQEIGGGNYCRPHIVLNPEELRRT